MDVVKEMTMVLGEDYADAYAKPYSQFISMSEATDLTSLDREDKLNRALHDYDMAEGEDKLRLEQTILSYGWIPGIPYNAETRYRAGVLEGTSITKARYDIIDSTEDTPDNYEAVKNNDILKPIYIVLVSGTALFSKITKKVTNGPFSHAAISIDDTFRNMYSFNMDPKYNGPFGGLSIETLNDYNKDSRLGIYAIFVKKDDLKKVEKKLNEYLKQKDKTTYSMLNIAAIPTGIVIQKDLSMICSEFVDYILKMVNIDIVDKASPLVNPNDFYRAYMKNKKIYKIYEGMVKNFAPKTISSRVAKIQKSYIKEMTLMEAEFPVQFSDDGDLLIKNMKKLNYDAEVARSNSLLKIYYKEDNREGMKYELAKLFFIMNVLTEDKDISKEERNRIAATAANIFNTYLKLLLGKEKDFNFQSYYDSTPFNTAIIKVRRSTIHYSIDLLKRIVGLY